MHGDIQRPPTVLGHCTNLTHDTLAPTWGELPFDSAADSVHSVTSLPAQRHRHVEPDERHHAIHQGPINYRRHVHSVLGHGA